MTSKEYSYCDRAFRRAALSQQLSHILYFVDCQGLGAGRAEHAPVTQIRGHFGNNLLRRQKVMLDVDSLGKPGEIVVLPHRRRRRQTQQLEDQISADKEQSEPDTSSSILQKLEKEQDGPDITDFWANIKGFRLPYQPRDKLASNDWLELRKNIEKSFTTDQLSCYISEFNAIRRRRDHPVTSNHVENAAWRPGKSLYLETGSDSREDIASRIARDKSLNGKKLLAERILRDCWHLGITDEVGQLDMYLPSHAVSLFLNSDRCSFEALANSYQAKIDIARALELIRITGSETSCQSIRDIIENFCSQIRQDSITLTQLKRPQGNNCQPNIELLRFLGTKYGIYFDRTKRQSEVKLYYFADDKSAADNARRDLNLTQYSIDSPISFCTYLPSSEKANVYLVDTENTASWIDRKRQWFRWGIAPPRHVPEKIPAPFFDQDHSLLSSDLLMLLRGSLKADIGVSNESRIHETLTATVGNCLFLHKPDIHNGTLTAARLGEMSLPRIFTRNIPKIASFLRLLTPYLGMADCQIHRIRLSPSTTNTHILPPLELEIEVRLNPQSQSSPNLVLRKAKAVLLENNIDYLIPENNLDLRFTRTIYRNISDISCGSKADGSVQNDDSLSLAIRGCLQHVSLTSRGLKDSTSSLPAFCHLSLPKEAVELNWTQKTSYTSDLVKLNAVEDPSEYVKAEYMFPPLNALSDSRILLYDFDGERLNYGYYESGPLFANHNTCVSLDMDVMCNESVADSSINSASSIHSGALLGNTLPEEFHSFYRSACKLAFEIGRHGEIPK
ncbi:Mitochondrial inner-membrane-bound regulator domain containing protein [Elaphomyces granulatus]